MTSPEIFIFRLRLHRERHQVSVAQIAAATRIKREFFDALERNDLSKWPHGVYARAWIRAYATLVGLDPTDTVEEFCRLFPQGDRRSRETFVDMAAIVGQPAGYRFEHRETDRRRGQSERTVRPDSVIARVAHAVLMTMIAALGLRRRSALYGPPVASR